MYLIGLIVDNFPQIAGEILIIAFTSFATLRLTIYSAKREAKNKFKTIFTSEREKLKRFDIQNYFDQEQAIFDISEYLSENENKKLKSMWNDYKSIEEQNREATMPNENFSQSLITYKNNKKEELISKIGDIIRFMK